MTIDTLSIAKDLRGSELSGPQADAIAAAIGRALAETDDNRSEIAKLVLEMRTEFAANAQRLEAMEQRLTAKMEAMRSSLLIWLIGVILAGAGLIVTVSRLHS